MPTGELFQAITSSAEERNELGLAWARQGKWQEAVRAYCQALELQADYVAAHVNLGAALVERGELAAAKACYRTALRLQRGCPQAHNYLGEVFFRQEQVAEAVAFFREAVRLKSDYVRALVNLGSALVDQGELAEGVVHYEAALSVEPNSAVVHDKLAEVFVAQGLPAEGVASCLHALRLDPNLAQAYFRLGELAAQGHYEFTPQQIAQIEKLLASGVLASEDAAGLCFTLAMLLDRQGYYDDAFQQYHRGNELKRAWFRGNRRAFDAEYHRAYVDRLIATFDRDYFDRILSFGHDTETPVFVVGIPRSGTTLVQQILCSHPEVVGAGELRDLELILDKPGEVAGSRASYPSYMSSVSRDTAYALGERYLERLSQLGGEALRVVDKMPHNYLHLGALAALFPRARVVHCRRDAMDACLSCYCQNFRWLNYTCSLEHLGLHYRQYERLMAHWRGVLPLRVHDVSYEELATNPEATIRQLVAFCGLEWHPQCLVFHENRNAVRTASKLQVRRPVYTSSIGRWKRYELHLGPLQKALA